MDSHDMQNMLLSWLFSVGLLLLPIYTISLFLPEGLTVVRLEIKFGVCSPAPHSVSPATTDSVQCFCGQILDSWLACEVTTYHHPTGLSPTPPPIHNHAATIIIPHAYAGYCPWNRH